MTGQVENFRCNWNDNLVFTDSAGVISLEKAQQHFRDKLGLKLLFQLSYADRDSKPYLVYTNVYNNSFIDAKTGEVVRSENNWGKISLSRSSRKNSGKLNAQTGPNGLLSL